MNERLFKDVQKILEPKHKPAQKIMDLVNIIKTLGDLERIIPRYSLVHQIDIFNEVIKISYSKNNRFWEEITNSKLFTEWTEINLIYLLQESYIKSRLWKFKNYEIVTKKYDIFVLKCPKEIARHIIHLHNKEIKSKT